MISTACSNVPLLSCRPSVTLFSEIRVPYFPFGMQVAESEIRRSQRAHVAFVTTSILQIRWTDDGDKDVAALATMYIAEVPNESSISQRSFHQMF